MSKRDEVGLVNAKVILEETHGEEVSKLIRRRNKLNMMGTPEKPLSNEVIFQLNILRASMEHQVRGYTGSAEIITEQLAYIMLKINSGRGTLGRLIQDSTIAENFSQTILNLKKSTKGLNENMEAAKHNFLLKGYFNKKDKAAAKAKEEEQKKKEEEKKKNENNKN